MKKVQQMKSILEFLLESIGYSELSKIVEFDRIESYKAYNIIEDHNGSEELGYSKKWGPESMIFVPHPRTEHYKIMVNGICVGVFSFIYGEDMYKLRGDEMYFECFALPLAIKRNDISGKTSQEIDRNIFIDIAEETLYVPYLFLFKDEKNTADLAPTATIKVVFDEIKRIAKSKGCRYILAIGKDDRTTRLYQLVGGFKKMTGYPSYKEYRDIASNTISESEEFYRNVVNHTVYYEL